MKTRSKNLSLILKLCIAGVLVIFAGCRKEPMEQYSFSPHETHTYMSMNDFYNQNGVPKQTHVIDASIGGSFTTPQGTVVTIPPNAFVTQSGNPVAGNVTIEFKDIYTKSDMLLSNRDTRDWWGRPLVSGGEFFIRAMSGSIALGLSQNQSITIKQPADLTEPNNLAMDAFTLWPDSIGQQAWGGMQNGWVQNSTDSFGMSSYIFNLYNFGTPLDSGIWCNSDNAYFFSSYQQVSLICEPMDDPLIYNTDVFLLFKNFSSAIHVYGNGNSFPYYYAPLGFQCTLVAIGMKQGKLYSSFVPVNINASQTVNFSLSETTTENFKAKLKTVQ